MSTGFLFSYEDNDDEVEEVEESQESSGPQILSISALTEQIKGLLEDTFPSVWVCGEISNFSRPQSGHCYLTLKDDNAQIRAAIWRNAASRVKFELHDGMEVVCRAHLDVYAPRGTYQLVIDSIEPKGIGALELALRQLRDKLAKEGLFDQARKRPLPSWVRRVAVVTSPTGAAIQDFLQVLGRRWRGADVLIVPTRVQGEGAAREIAAAIALANRLPIEIDCLVVTRGGGSLEDLWAFNEEPVVRAIYASRIPVISAIGHEIDVTLADLVADVRALTPSEAAELVAPAAVDVTRRFRELEKRMTAAMRWRISAAQTRCDAVRRHRAFRRPLSRIEDLSRHVDELDTRLARGMARQMQDARGLLTELAGKLSTLSPLAVLSRGYSVTTLVANGRVIRNAGDLAVGDNLYTRFAQGTAISRVEKSDE